MPAGRDLAAGDTANQPREERGGTPSVASAVNVTLCFFSSRARAA
jgi:hypothetical protein